MTCQKDIFYFISIFWYILLSQAPLRVMWISTGVKSIVFFFQEIFSWLLEIFNVCVIGAWDDSKKKLNIIKIGTEVIES